MCNKEHADRELFLAGRGRASLDTRVQRLQCGLMLNRTAWRNDSALQDDRSRALTLPFTMSLDQCMISMNRSLSACTASSFTLQSYSERLQERQISDHYYAPQHLCVASKHCASLAGPSALFVHLLYIFCSCDNVFGQYISTRRLRALTHDV